jgi:hypothetical protein
MYIHVCIYVYKFTYIYVYECACIYVYIRIYMHNDVSVHVSDDANIAGPATNKTSTHMCVYI